MSNEIDLDWLAQMEPRKEFHGNADRFKPSIEEANRLAQEFKLLNGIEDNQEQEMKQDNGWFERGELPPVGVECIFDPGNGEHYFNSDELKAKGERVAVIAHTKYKNGCGYVAVFQWDLDGCCGVSSANPYAFRPIRTERDVLIEIITSNLSGTAGQVADAILAAGFKLEAK